MTPERDIPIDAPLPARLELARDIDDEDDERELALDDDLLPLPIRACASPMTLTEKAIMVIATIAFLRRELRMDVSFKKELTLKIG